MISIKQRLEILISRKQRFVRLIPKNRALKKEEITKTDIKIRDCEGYSQIESNSAVRQ